MNFAKSSLSELCEKQEIGNLLQSYVELCSANSENEANTPEEKTSSETSTRKKSDKARKSQSKSNFPNLAGFCRYLGISTEELEEIASKYPHEYGMILTVLEDEALNSGLCATLLSAYLKKRLGYDATPRNIGSQSQLQICFEHDIFEDGE